MVRRNSIAIEEVRAQIASDAWISARMLDLPNMYSSLLPLTEDASELAKEEIRIRKMFEADLENYLHNPYRKVKTFSGELNLSATLTPVEVIEFGLSMQPEAGLPWPIKEGSGVDPFDHEFKPFKDFHEVEEDRNRYRNSELFQKRQRLNELAAGADENGKCKTEEEDREFLALSNEIVQLEQEFRRNRRG